MHFLICGIFSRNGNVQYKPYSNRKRAAAILSNDHNLLKENQFGQKLCNESPNIYIEDRLGEACHFYKWMNLFLAIPSGYILLTIHSSTCCQILLVIHMVYYSAWCESYYLSKTFGERYSKRNKRNLPLLLL